MSTHWLIYKDIYEIFEQYTPTNKYTDRGKNIITSNYSVLISQQLTNNNCAV